MYLSVNSINLVDSFKASSIISPFYFYLKYKTKPPIKIPYTIKAPIVSISKSLAPESYLLIFKYSLVSWKAYFCLLRLSLRLLRQAYKRHLSLQYFFLAVP